MGAAQAKNTAKELASITNDIAQQTNTTDQNYINNYMNTNFSGCSVKTGGSLNVDNYVINNIYANQIATALQNAKVVNDISQKLAQKAKANMGFLGVGYASASNSASTEANSTTTIVNTMNTVMQNLQNNVFNFTCSNSTIEVKDDLNITNQDFNTIASSQTVENTQIVDLSNSISQDITQTASATVQGAVAFLLLIVIIIGVVCVVFFKGVGDSAKIILPVILIVGIIIVFVWMYAAKAPPFFAPPVYVFPNAVSPSENGAYGDKPPVDMKERTITMDSPPLRYLYPLVKDINTDPKISLFNLVATQQIGSGNTQSNHGYNNANAVTVNDRWHNLVQQYAKYDPINEMSTSSEKIFLIDIPLMQYYTTEIPSSKSTDYTTNGVGVEIFYAIGTGGKVNCPGDDKCTAGYLALPNEDDFGKYASQHPTCSKFLRFVLADLFGFSTNVYFDDDEYVRYLNDQKTTTIDMAGNVKDKSRIIRLQGNRGDVNQNMVGSVSGTSEFGVYPGAVYNTQKHMKTWGIAILVIVLVGVFIFIFVYARTKALKK